jgi:uncharacterized protein
MQRDDVTFTSGDNKVSAWVYRPAGDGPFPAVVLAHGFGATREARLDAYAERFWDAGFVAVVFDYRHFGASEGEPRQLLSIAKQIEDWHAAVAYTRSRQDVDPESVALWGTSFAGGHVVRIAAEDARIAAVIAQIPFMDGLATTLKLPPLSAIKITGLGVADIVRGGFRGSRVRMPLVGRPGQASAMPTDGALAGYSRMFEGKEWENSVCTRIGLAVPLYRPGRQASEVTCPLLVQAGEHDELTPSGPAEKAAKAAPQGEFSSYPIGHFDAYFNGAFEKMTSEQVAFLRKYVGGSV